MAYNAKSQKIYNEKCKRMNLKYTPQELAEYNRICKYCNDNGYSLQGYIKQLIKNDLDSKNIHYVD